MTDGPAGRSRGWKAAVPMAWIILGAAFLTQMASAGGHFSFGVFLKPLSQEFHWSRGATSLSYSLLWWVSSAAGIFLGWLSDRIGYRRVILMGGIFFSLGIFLSAFVQNLWQYCLFFGIFAGIGRASTRAPLLAAVFAYFNRRRGLAAGICLSGTGVGTLLFPALAHQVISWINWRAGYAVLGILATVILIPAALIFRPPRPGEAEQDPAEATPPAERAAKEGILGAPEEAWSLFTLCSSRGFWVLLATSFACCLSHSMPLAHIVAFASDKGIPDLRAASVLGLMGITATIGRLVFGLSSDRIGGRKTVLFCIALQTVLMLYVAFADTLRAFYIFAAGFGLAYGGVLPQYAVVTRELFGMRRFGTAYGLNSFATSAGMGAGGVLGGYLFDLTGSYFLPFMTSTMLGLVATGCAFKLLFLKGRVSPAPGAGAPPRAGAGNTRGRPS